MLRFLTLWPPSLRQKVIEVPQLHEHTFQTSTCQIWCWSNWLWSVECPWNSVKFEFMKFFKGKFFLDISKAQKFPLATRNNQANFCLDWKRFSAFISFEKNIHYSITFEKHVTIHSYSLGPSLPNSNGYQLCNLYFLFFIDLKLRKSFPKSTVFWLKKHCH